LKNLIVSDVILRLASYFTPIAHTPGRIRVRVSSEIKKEASNFDIKNLDGVIKQIKGIKNVKFNYLIGSVTIEYDQTIFAKELWDDLLAGRNIKVIAQKINELARDIV
jgi:hypothetical protein